MFCPCASIDRCAALFTVRDVRGEYGLCCGVYVAMFAAHSKIDVCTCGTAMRDGLISEYRVVSEYDITEYDIC